MSQVISISVIIPTRHREIILWQTVEKALEATKGKNAEVIIINDGDESIKAPSSFVNQILLYNNPKKGVSSARNFGASIARGKTLFFIDDDMWINAQAIDWIDTKMQQEVNWEAVYLLNWQYPEKLNEILTKTKLGNFLLDSNYHLMWGRMKQHGTQPKTGLYEYDSVASCSMMMQKSLFRRIGGYKEEFIFQGEDLEMSDRLNKGEVPIVAVFDVTLHHNHQDRMEIRGFLKRVANGYATEFKARAEGYLPRSDKEFTGSKKLLFEFFSLTEPAWVVSHKLMPRGNIFKKLNNRIIGMLSGLQKFKQWKIHS